MSYLDLLNIKYKKGLPLILTIIIVLIMLGVYLNRNICEVYKTYAYISDGYLVVNVSIDEPLVISELEYIKVDKKNYNAKVSQVSEVILDKENMFNYETIYLESNYKYKENQVFEISLFYNKEKGYQKLKKILF